MSLVNLPPLTTLSHLHSLQVCGNEPAKTYLKAHFPRLALISERKKGNHQDSASQKSKKHRPKFLEAVFPCQMFKLGRAEFSIPLLKYINFQNKEKDATGFIY